MKMFKYSFFTALIAVFIFVSNAAVYGSVAAKSIDDEIQVRNRIVAEYIANNPKAVLEIPFTEIQLKEAETRRDDVRKNEIINKISLESEPLQVQLNGALVNAPAHMSVIEGQVMVPLRWSAELLGATSVGWDAATHTVTITTPQDFYNMEKYRSYATALKSPIDEYNDKIWPLPDKVKDMEVPELVSNRHWVLNLKQFKPESIGLPAPRDNITITITSPKGIYVHSSVANSIENHQGHYYLPMDWLEYLFNVRVSYNEAANMLSIQTPDPEQIKSEIARIEKALTPDNADEAVKLWGRGMQTRNGALQYAALSPQLRHQADKSVYVSESYWVTGCSSPQVGPITIESRNQLSDTKVEYTISFPEIFSGQTHAIATEKMVVEKLSDEGYEGWFITQILEASGYGIIDSDASFDLEGSELLTTPLTAEELEYFNGDEFFNGEYMNIRNQFLSSLYDVPERIDLFNLFYCGSGHEENLTEAERKAVIAYNSWDREPECGCTKISRANMDTVLTKYLGITLADTEKINLEKFTYLENYDAYYYYHGDTNYRAKASFSGGEREGSIIRLFYDDRFMDDGRKVLTLREQEEAYLFVSNEKERNSYSEKQLSYIEAYDEKTGMLTFDEIEWVVQEDAGRVGELGLDANLDFPNGFYIYNENDQTNMLRIAEDVKVYLVNWHDLSNHTLTDINGLTVRMAEYQAPYHLTIDAGMIVEILEQYVP